MTGELSFRILTVVAEFLVLLLSKPSCALVNLLVVPSLGIYCLYCLQHVVLSSNRSFGTPSFCCSANILCRRSDPYHSQWFVRLLCPSARHTHWFVGYITSITLPYWNGQSTTQTAPVTVTPTSQVISGAISSAESALSSIKSNANSVLTGSSSQFIQA